MADLIRADLDWEHILLDDQEFETFLSSVSALTRDVIHTHKYLKKVVNHTIYSSLTNTYEKENLRRSIANEFADGTRKLGLQGSVFAGPWVTQVQVELIPNYLFPSFQSCISKYSQEIPIPDNLGDVVRSKCLSKQPTAERFSKEWKQLYDSKTAKTAQSAPSKPPPLPLTSTSLAPTAKTHLETLELKVLRYDTGQSLSESLPLHDNHLLADTPIQAEPPKEKITSPPLNLLETIGNGSLQPDPQPVNYSRQSSSTSTMQPPPLPNSSRFVGTTIHLPPPAPSKLTLLPENCLRPDGERKWEKSTDSVSLQSSDSIPSAQLELPRKRASPTVADVRGEKRRELPNQRAEWAEESQTRPLMPHHQECRVKHLYVDPQSIPSLPAKYLADPTGNQTLLPSINLAHEVQQQQVEWYHDVFGPVEAFFEDGSVVPALPYKFGPVTNFFASSLPYFDGSGFSGSAAQDYSPNS